MKKRNKNHRRLMVQFVASTSGGYYCGEWVKGNRKYKMRCPYCQDDKPGKKKFTPGDRSAALLVQNHDGYERWSFNCCGCGKSTSLDYLIADHPEIVMIPNPPLGDSNRVGIASSVVMPYSKVESSCLPELSEYKVIKLDAVSPAVQAGMGGYLDYRIACKRQKEKNWWDYF